MHDWGIVAPTTRTIVMPEPLVYAGGPITGLRAEDAIDWREDSKEYLAEHGIRILSPLRGKGYLLLEKTTIKDSYEDKILSKEKAITTRDRFDVMRCDAVLMNFVGADKVSKGSIMELGWADAWRKPIVLAMESGNVHDHAMVRAVSGYIVPTLEEALEVIISILSPNL